MQLTKQLHCAASAQRQTSSAGCCRPSSTIHRQRLDAARTPQQFTTAAAAVPAVAGVRSNQTTAAASSHRLSRCVESPLIAHWQHHDLAAALSKERCPFSAVRIACRTATTDRLILPAKPRIKRRTDKADCYAHGSIASAPTCTGERSERSATCRWQDHGDLDCHARGDTGPQFTSAVSQALPPISQLHRKRLKSCDRRASVAASHRSCRSRPSAEQGRSSSASPIGIAACNRPPHPSSRTRVRIGR